MEEEWALPVTRRPWRVGAVCAVVLAVIVWRIGPHAALPAFCYLGVVGVALAFIDAEQKRLPDVLTLPSYGVAAVLLGVAAGFTDHGGTRFTHALAGMVVLGLIYGVYWFIVPSGIGFGDVKLAGLLGLYLGWLGLHGWVVGVCSAFVLGLVYSVGLVVTRRAKLWSGREVPFGPFMLAGALAAILTA